ncbi:MAG TPA: DUF4270 family protein, partial [Panacibacter sp.]|nr:DUF4270 family protein [Panacibacter sp.]
TDDPLFGKTTAIINVQLKPAIFPFYFPVSKDSLFLDSVVLVLGYKGVWGDTTKDMSLRVYNISNDDPLGNLKADSSYLTTYEVPQGEQVTENNTPKTVKFSKLNDFDSTGAFKEPTAGQIRIRLSSDYGNSLLKDYDTLTAYKNDTLFNALIKGLQIVPEKTSNALMKIGLTSYYNAADTNTKIAIYYHYKDRVTADKFDTSIAYFRCNTFTSGTANTIRRDRSGSKYADFIAAGTGNLNDSLIYIDANPGIYTRITIPGLDTISNKIIHHAELIMEQAPDLLSGNDQYLTPPALFLTPYSTDSMRRFALPNDVLFSSTGAMTNQSDYGCYPVSKTDPVTGKTTYTYSFDMSRYLQGIITRKEKTYGLVLFAPFNDFIYASETSGLLGSIAPAAGSPLNSAATGRIRLGGGSSISHKMKFHIIYSEIPK